MLYLYHGTTSVCSIKIRLTLEEKGLPWEGEILHLQRGDQFRPEYLRLNPNAVVPTLVHDDRTIIESTIIMEYLDERFPEVPLMPDDAYGRSQARLWLKRVDELHGACATLTTAIAFRRYFMAQNPDGRAAYVDRVKDSLRRSKLKALMDNGLRAPDAITAFHQHEKFVKDMGRALERSNYLVGDALSLADAAALPYVVRAEILGLDRLWLDRWPRVASWLDRMRQRPTFERAVARYWDDDARRRFDVPREDVWGKVQKISSGT